MPEINEKKQTDFAIDTLASMVIYVEDIFNEFYSSKTCKVLYDESTKLWWNGPSYIADMYKEELNHKLKTIA